MKKTGQKVVQGTYITKAAKEYIKNLADKLETFPATVASSILEQGVEKLRRDESGETIKSKNKRR